MIPNNETDGLHPEDIKAALRKKRVTQKAIADELHVSETVINLVINDRSRSRRIAQYIADKIGKPVDEIWPGSYTNKDKH
jgi:lambda repressor-like predicted transcriptional regulator